MNERQKRIVRRLIREYDKTYVEEGMRSRVDDFQDDERYVAFEKVDLARSLLGFRTQTALRRAAGITKKEPDD
ncbi:MAG: hypothetical protein ACYC1K_00760 [Minisyncoccota bacterium]